MSQGPESTEVEQPFIDQLLLMGWEHTAGSLDDPSVTGRDSFREVLLLDDLKAALYRINLDPDGKPWLDEGRITQALNALQRLGTAKLLEANQAATELLLKGTVVDGVEGWDQVRGRTVHFIDWDNPDNNRFRVINQFQVACPAGQSDKHIRPDLVLFVNGIPLVVVECKSPYAATPLEDAVNQLQRYANRRRDLGVVDVNEGNEQLFHYSQFIVATCGEQARAGTFYSLAVHFLEWKDTSPTPMAEVASELGKAGAALTSQERLVAGMLRPAHVLDIVRHFTLFMEAGGRTLKLVCRYQQFRAVQLAIQRMPTGKTRVEDGEQDRRGGIIWHSQGSGKSLTMVFLIRKMRSDPRLTGFNIVVVTDRRDLQKQLSDTAALTDEVLTIVKPERQGPKTVSSYEVLQQVLRRKCKDLVFAMIQKYRGGLLDAGAPDDENKADVDAEERLPTKTQPLPELNSDEDILVLVDEAHRSHTNTAHANLMRGPAQLREDRLHRDAHHHAGQGADGEDLRRLHRPLHHPGVRGRWGHRADPLRGSHHRGRSGGRAGAGRGLRGHADRTHPRGARGDQAEVRDQGPCDGGRAAHRGQGPQHALPLRGEHPAQRLQGPGGGGQSARGDPLLRGAQDRPGRAGRGAGGSASKPARSR